MWSFIQDKHTCDFKQRLNVNINHFIEKQETLSVLTEVSDTCQIVKQVTLISFLEDAIIDVLGLIV